MTVEMIERRASLTEAFYALSMAKPIPDAEVLDDLIRRYPDFASELTDMAVQLAMDALSDEDEAGPAVNDAETSNMILKAMSRFQNKLHAVKAEQRSFLAAAKSSVTNPFSSLDTPELRDLGRRLHANTVFVIKLRDRLIDESTMTEGFKRHVAEETKAPMELVAMHFRAAATVGNHVNYKADQKPEALKKQTFEEAVRTSGLTAEQQEYLLNL